MSAHWPVLPSLFSCPTRGRAGYLATASAPWWPSRMRKARPPSAGSNGAIRRLRFHPCDRGEGDGWRGHPPYSETRRGSGTSTPQSSPQPGQTPGPAAPPHRRDSDEARGQHRYSARHSTPARRFASSAPQAGDQRPAVTISGAPQGHSGSSNKKWLVIALVAAGAAAGVARRCSRSRNSASSASTNNPLSIGSPTVSVGAVKTGARDQTPAPGYSGRRPAPCETDA